MNKDFTEFDSFIDLIQEADIEKISQDLSLKQKGYKVFYIVDAFDLINYCDYFYLKKHKYEAIAYHSIFEAYNDTQNQLEYNILLPNEYKIELLRYKNKIIADAKKFEQEVNYLISNNTSDDTNLEQLDTFLHQLITFDTGINVFEKFQDLITTKVELFRFKSTNPDVERIINEFFELATPTNFIDKIDIIYYEYKKKEKIEFKNTNNPFELYKKLENLYKDIIVIQRILFVNKKIEENKIEPKTIFLYFSSALKTDKIFNIIRETKTNTASNIDIELVA